MGKNIGFVGLGAPKCGTTWLSTQLSAHPEIGFARTKETYFFADTIARRLAGEELHCFERGFDWYHDQFPPETGAHRVRGEFCPSYLYSREAPARLAAYAPEVKLLLCLRPPVDMVYSWYCYNRTGVVVRLPPTFEEAMELRLVRDLGRYAFHLDRYLDRFPRENFLVVDFGAIRTEPVRVRREVYRFLGVNPDFAPVPGVKGWNAARTSRFAWAQVAARHIHAGVSRTPGLARLLQSPRMAKGLEQVYHRLNSREQRYPELSSGTREHWEDYYREDQQNLTTLLRGVATVRQTPVTQPQQPGFSNTFTH